MTATSAVIWQFGDRYITRRRLHGYLLGDPGVLFNEAYNAKHFMTKLSNVASKQGRPSHYGPLLIRGTNVERFLWALLIRAAVKDELSLGRRKSAQLEAAGFAAKERVVLGNLDRTLRGQGCDEGFERFDAVEASFDLISMLRGIEI